MRTSELNNFSLIARPKNPNLPKILSLLNQTVEAHVILTNLNYFIVSEIELPPFVER
jgi:hypothetical protein